MSWVDANTELMIEKRIKQSEEALKKEIHKSNNKAAVSISQQSEHFDTKIGELQHDTSEILVQVEKLYSKKWVERTMLSVGVFVIMWVSTIIWNVFNEKLTQILEWMLK